MPRPERLISEQGPVADLARELRLLRGGQGYRALAARANFSVSTLSKAANGRELPTKEVVLAFATACGATKDQQDHIEALWQTAWHSLHGQVTGNQPIWSPPRLSVPATRPTP